MKNESGESKRPLSAFLVLIIALVLGGHYLFSGVMSFLFYYLRLEEIVFNVVDLLIGAGLLLGGIGALLGKRWGVYITLAGIVIMMIKGGWEFLMMWGMRELFGNLPFILLALFFLYGILGIFVLIKERKRL